MASPISATIELSRCWTTERVMGSTEVVMDGLRLDGGKSALLCSLLGGLGFRGFLGRLILYSLFLGRLLARSLVAGSFGDSLLLNDPFDRTHVGIGCVVGRDLQPPCGR